MKAKMLLALTRLYEPIRNMVFPWNVLYEAFGPANIKWCEARLEALIQEPANTWSNLAYIVVGLWVGWKNPERRGRLFGRIVFVMGALSFIYHASNNHATQVLDFVGMFLYVGLLFTWNVERLKQNSWSLKSRTLFYVIYVNVNMLMLVAFPWAGLPIQRIVMLNTALIFASELVIYLRGRARPDGSAYRTYGIAVCFMLLASIASALDYKRVWCDSHNHFLQGHATWHLLSAISAYFIYSFYRKVRTGNHESA